MVIRPALVVSLACFAVWEVRKLLGRARGECGGSCTIAVRCAKTNMEGAVRI